VGDLARGRGGELDSEFLKRETGNGKRRRGKSETRNREEGNGTRTEVASRSFAKLDRC
jgi:hypothetical protein